MHDRRKSCNVAQNLQHMHNAGHDRHIIIISLIAPRYTAHGLV